MILLSELCYLCLLSQYLFLEFLYLLVVSVSVLLQLLFQGSLHLEEERREGGREVAGVVGSSTTQATFLVHKLAPKQLEDILIVY